MELISSYPNLSFEFFPAKTEQSKENLDLCAMELAALNPDFFSVTFGAGGSNQEGTTTTVKKIRAITNINTIPHLSCINSNKNNITQILDDYKSQKIKHIVALRGDLPNGMDSPNGDFRFGKDLVQFIREHSGKHFYIFVACYPEFHPQTTNVDLGLHHFKEKINAGANCAITQYFYNADAYFRFIELCHKYQINIPIIPGIMPITNFKQLTRFSDICGAEIPKWIRFRLQSYCNDLQSIRQFGEEIVTELCAKLLANGAPGLHFYTLNKAKPSIAILNNLSIKQTL